MISFDRPSVMLFSVALSVGGLLVPLTASATVEGAAKDGVAAPARVEPLLLADVVVNGQSAPPAAPVAPVAPAPVVVQPQPVAPAPVVEPSHQTTVIEHENHNYMATIAWSAIAGGVVGVLVGGSIYFLADNQTHGQRVGYWAAGGVLVGVGVGLTQVVVQESRLDRATVSLLPADPAPTYRLALYETHF
jgi:hypothetical protein